ncbi:ABC transporter permease [Paraburkholderia fungorum]|uniref:ABC transporter permease n=1 Tax=Paraburkholderia fungorum TaxID=134537 RepID=UPI0038B9D77D
MKAKAEAFAVPPVRAVKTLAAPQRTSDMRALLIVVIGLIVAIEVASRFVPAYIMPSPASIGVALLELLQTDYVHVAVTILRLAGAIVFAMIAGVLVGLLMATSPRVGAYLKSLVLIDTGIPALSWMLIAVFWFKDAELRIFFILAVILLPFYALNVYEGIKALPNEWLDMIQSFRPTRRQVMRYLILPHVVSYIFLTTKSVIGYAIRMVVFAELVASAVGIGSRMSLAQSTFRIDSVLAWTVLLVVLNLVLQWLAGVAERRLLPWRIEANVR